MRTIKGILNRYIMCVLAALLDGRQSLGGDVQFQEGLQLPQAVGNARHQRKHPAQIRVLVGVQERLEFGVKQLQVLLNQDSLASLRQPLAGRFVQVHLDPFLLLLKPLLDLPQKRGTL